MGYYARWRASGMGIKRLKQAIEGAPISEETAFASCWRPTIPTDVPYSPLTSQPTPILTSLLFDLLGSIKPLSSVSKTENKLKKDAPLLEDHTKKSCQTWTAVWISRSKSRNVKVETAYRLKSGPHQRKFGRSFFDPFSLCHPTAGAPSTQWHNPVLLVHFCQ
jgi:hypothetical protein